MGMSSRRLDYWFAGHLYMIAEERQAQADAEAKMLETLGLAKRKQG